MRYGYHVTTNRYPYSTTKIHAFKGRSNYLPICGTIIVDTHERHFIATNRLSFVPSPYDDSCQNCLRILVSRYVKSY